MGLFDKSTPESSRAFIRDTLYADLPLDLWPSGNTQADAFPWGNFIAARKHVGAKGEIKGRVLTLDIVVGSGAGSNTGPALKVEGTHCGES